MINHQRHCYRALVLNIRNSAGMPPPGCREEFLELIRAADIAVAASLDAVVQTPKAGTYVGSGKLDEIAALARESKADLVAVDAGLSPVQERDIGQATGCRVLDRTTLILDIFAQRAATYEGKLQVELAQLRHLSTRLVRGWSHLERQKGGIGLRGPGETQLETDRRLLGERIRLLRQRLHVVDKRRRSGRARRQVGGTPVVALVGYTNAGKSTLFNRLVGAGVCAEDKLFATLDPTVRRWQAPAFGTVLLSDTVGFIRDLPHELVAAFRSTLQETREADLLLHVIDSSDPQLDERIADVETVLREIGADQVPVLKVFNKADRSDAAIRVLQDARGCSRSAVISAARGDGLDALAEAVGERLGMGRLRGSVHIPYAAAELRARLFELDAIEAEFDSDEDGFNLHINIPGPVLQGLSRLPGEAGKVAAQALFDYS